MNKLTLLVALLILSITITSAQSVACSPFYQQALHQTEEVCDETGRNQACYGNNTVNLTPYSSETTIDFNAPGDTTDIAIIRTLSLSALDDATGDWGIAMMRLLANINPTHTDDVTMLLFGDVEVESAVDQHPTQAVLTTTYANIRRYPGTSSAVVASITENSTLSARGRLADNTWIQVYDSVTNLGGWISADLLTNINIELLDVVEPARPYFGPMQAFYFRSGNNQLNCASVPSDGLLIQTPEGVGRVTVWINEVTIDFLSDTGATAFVHTQSDNLMSIDMLEGNAVVTSDQGGYIAVAGSSVNVEYGDDSGSPKVNVPAPSSGWSENNSPASLLDRTVETIAPANLDNIAATNGLTAQQYDEIVTYGYVITQSTTTSDQAVTSSTTADNPTASSTNNQSDPVANNTDSTVTTSSTNNQNDPASPPSNNPPPPSNDSNNDDNNSGSDDGDDCPGNSCNAPGQNNDDDCPGNSCNAPGQNKDKKDKKK